MVVCESAINNIMGGIENTGGVTLHNHRRKLKQRFDIIKKLGQGTYGKVQLGINKETGQEVAIKTIKKCKIETEADLIRIRREIQIMSSVQHPNIIHIYEVFENREKMVLVMEYAAGGELYDYLSERKVLTEDEARRIFRQIATAVYYCHKHKICHRDLKLENILLDENGSAKIADFGLSNVFDERRLLSTFCGSPLYASPEIVKGTPYHGPEVDCWSLGVLLYTLVYGAMPFDGSNFKRLVKQISQGDYFEPKKPSSASPLIRDMLTVVSEKRANIENICAHWWVNTTYPDSCLDIAEELANQTPVRLDLLLSLVPPLPQAGSDQLMIAGESSSIVPPAAESSVPTRSQSVGSLMDMVPSAEKRIRDLVSEDSMQSPKRKLEVTVSTENANLSNSGAKRKEKQPQKNEEDISKSAILLNKTETNSATDVAQSSQVPVTKNSTQTIVTDMELKPDETAANDADEECDMDPNLQGAACSELIEESKKNETKEKKKMIKVKKVVKVEKPTTITSKSSAEIEEKINDKENKISDTTESEKKDDTKIPVKRKIIKKKPLTDKANVLSKETKTELKSEGQESEKSKPECPPIAPAEESKLKTDVKNDNEESQSLSKPVERRRSKIFETAEKFQNLLTNNESKTSVLEKPKKIFIPGVNVGGFKKEFERKASLTSTAVPDLKKPLSRKSIPNKSEDTTKDMSENNSPVEEIAQIPITQEIIEENEVKSESETTVSPVDNGNESSPVNDEEKIRKQNAVSMIANFISKEGTRKSKSRPCMMRKPPVPFGINGRSASGSIGLIPAQLSPAHNMPEDISELGSPTEINVKSSAEITLKSATLPRRKTTKAEIKLDYPPPKPAQMEFKTEMAHRIESRPELKSQRSEIIVPVKNDTANRIRSTSLDPEMKFKESPKERIIPISFEKEDNGERADLSQSKPPMPKPYQSQRSVQSQRFGSLSRQSTHDSDSEATISESMEPIRKSPREYIIPIAVEGGGYVTPRATSLEPSDSSSTMSSRRPLPKLSQMKRLSSILNHEGLDDGLPFSSLHRHNSVSRDSDNEDSRSEPLHMHRLRSSRPTQRPNLEHTDSLSSGEEDDDDGFEILTAEKLFSTLLSRVRSLTQRLNVEDNGRLGSGFPRSRLFDSFDHGSKLWKDPMSRFSPMDRSLLRNQSNSTTASSDRSGAPWRRSVSRDLATDIERVYNDTPTATATMPRDKSKKQKEVNVDDLQLSDKDAIALSYLTPGLSRRIQSQILSQLPTTRSRRSTYNNDEQKIRKRSKDRHRSDSETPSEYFKHNTSHDGIAEELDYKTNNTMPEYNKNRSHSEDNGLQYYKLSDLKKQAEQQHLETEKGDDFGKYKPYRHCYRSHSLMEPNNTNKNSLYGKNANYSSGNVEPVYEDEKSTRNSYSPTPKYNIVQRGSLSRDIDHDGPQQAQEPSTSTRRVSRFLRPDFYSNCVYTKEKQKRELETQKVLQEIRNKKHNDHSDHLTTKDHTNHSSSNDHTSAHKNSLNDKSVTHKDKKPQVLENNYVSLSPPPKNVEKVAQVVDKSNATENSAQEPIINNEEKKTKRESKISKLIRPKSFPTECKDAEKNLENKTSTLKKKIFSRSTTVDKQSPTSSEPHSSNQFLNSIEKKIRSIYLESTDKNKNDTNSRVKSTIRSLREQSEPRNMETCVTESGLIKRAVSSEDFSTFGSNKKNIKTLQPSRKSVSKILGLFKKYEDKPGSKSKDTENDGKKCKSKKNKTNDSVDSTSNKSKTKTVKDVDNKTEQFSSVRNLKPKVNSEENGAKKYNTNRSKLPVSPLKYSSPEAELKGRSDRSQNAVNERKYITGADNYKPDRKDLKLDLNFSNNSPQRTHYGSQTGSNLNKEENGVFSPSDDSLSMCSDFHLQDMSPVSDFKANSEEEANESMIDRIRRKSFYSRFNEKKKPRKSSILGSSLDYYTELANSHSGKSKKTKEHTNDVHVLNKSLTNSHVLMPTAKDVREYRRGFSMSDNLCPDTSNRYRDSMSYTNSYMEPPNEKIKYDGENNQKSLIAKPRGSNRRSSAPRLRDSSITPIPRESVSPNNDSDIRSGPSTSVSPQM